MGITPKKKRKNFARSLNPKPSHKFSPNFNHQLSYNHNNNPCQNLSHLKNSLHHRHHFTTTLLQPHLFPRKKTFKPNITSSNQTLPSQEQSSTPIFSLTLPCLSSLSPLRLFSLSHSASRQSKNPSDSSKTRHRAKSTTTEDRQGIPGFSLSSVESEELPADFQPRRLLKSLINLDTIGKKVASSQPLPIQRCTHSDHLCSLDW